MRQLTAYRKKGVFPVTLEQVLEEVGKELDTGSELISGERQNEKISEFQTAARQIRQELERIEEEGRVMRLGIVGEVKAGKTSFLNALLFGGRTVLPKAATPMTAALTRIRYSPNPAATVVFYSEADWKSVKSYADSYGQKIEHEYQMFNKKLDEEERALTQRAKNALGSFGRGTESGLKPVRMTRAQFEAARRNEVTTVEERSCHKIYEMAERHLSDGELRACLGQEKRITADIGEALMDELSNYVGADGAYTPIVKYTILELNLPELEGVEIIDTPGMNDPIISRGRITKNFLKECDALFLLSYCGQFLGEEDMKVISSMLPEEGIARCVLVGTKVDSAILQYQDRKATYIRARNRTGENCAAQAMENIQALGNPQIQKRLRDPNHPDTIQEPILTSAMAFSVAQKISAGIPLDSDEQLMIDNFKRRFPDFTADSKTLISLSGIEFVQQEVYPDIRADKEKIIAESKRETREGQRSKFVRLLEEIANEARQIKKDLSDGDIDQLREKLRIAQEGLDNARVAVSGIFDTAAVRVEKTIIPVLQIDVCTEVNNHLHIDVSSITETIPHVETDGHLWWKTTTRWDEHITTYTAQVVDVERNMRNFYTEILRLINGAMGEAVQLDQVRNNVLKAVEKAFDTSDRNYDENAILIPMNNALQRITIAHVDIDIEKYLSMLDQELAGINAGDSNSGHLWWKAKTLYENGTVKNDAIPLLKLAQEHVMGHMTDEICKAIAQQGEKIARELEKQAGVFIDQITEKLVGNHKKVESMIADKENNLKKLEQFIDALTAAKNRIGEADR